MSQDLVIRRGSVERELNNVGVLIVSVKDFRSFSLCATLDDSTDVAKAFKRVVFEARSELGQSYAFALF